MEQKFDRLKGANWFKYTNDLDVLVIGAGGIGSWTAILLSRIGCSIHIFDEDIYENHNMSGQFVHKNQINVNKASALASNIVNFSDGNATAYSEFYKEDSLAHNIVFCGLDNMNARKVAFDRWKNYTLGLSEEARKECLFIDGRLTSELLQIFIIKGTDNDSINKYEQEYLFNDEAVAELDCSFKQTSHCAAMIGSFITGFFTNWVSNFVEKTDNYFVPFFYEYYLPLNLTQSA